MFVNGESRSPLIVLIIFSDKLSNPQLCDLKRAKIVCVLIKLVPVNWQLVVEVEHARLSAFVGD